MMESNNESRYLLTAAIDFGTTFSGLAYSYRNDQESVYIISNWPDGTVAGKIPTTILFDPDFKFVAFGQEAIDRYAELAEDEEEKEHYFFHRFKMDLHKEKDVTQDLQLKDITGKTKNAKTIFSLAIKFLKDHLINTINERYPDNHLTENTIKWVLTVPAIWNDAAKQFMRKAGEKAGISTRNLQIVLEPEAASLCCLRTPRDKMISGGDLSLKNSKYLVIDVGGGTLDITAHQVIGVSKMKELYKASGGPLGGTKVDEQFIEYITFLFSKENILEIQRNHPSRLISLLQDFDLIKKKIIPKNKEKTLPCSIGSDVFNRFHFNSLSAEDRKGAEIKGSRLRIPRNVIEEMISRAVINVSDYVESLLLKPELNGIVEYIVLVGGFSNSLILVKKIKDLAERNQLSVVVPEEAHLSVVRGAVMFGWKPETIQTRKCRRTYGFAIRRPFIEKVHPESKMIYCDGTKLCDDIFDTLVEIDQNIEIDKMVTRLYTPDGKSPKTGIRLYASGSKHVNYTDEDGVFKIGELVFDTPYDENNEIQVEVFFGNTEIHVKAKYKATGNTAEKSFDFL